MEKRTRRIPVICLIALGLLLCFGLLGTQERLQREEEVQETGTSLADVLNEALDARKSIEESFLNDVSFGDSSLSQSSQVLREKIPEAVTTAGIYTNQGGLLYGFGELPETVSDLSLYTRLMGHMRSSAMLAVRDDEPVLLTLVKLGDPTNLSKSILYFEYPLTQLDVSVSDAQSEGFKVFIIGNDGQYYDCQSTEMIKPDGEDALSELVSRARKGEAAGKSGSIRFLYEDQYGYGYYFLSESSIGILTWTE